MYSSPILDGNVLKATFDNAVDYGHPTFYFTEGKSTPCSVLI
jgi:hypothetical protein